jgi:regulator of nucleoside diphosphate kinase
MRQKKPKIILARKDYEVITAYLNGGEARSSFDRTNAADLQSELKKAKIVSNDILPKDVVRINSTVILKDETADRVIELTVVTPDKADMKSKKISFMAPIGTALIGFKEGQKIKWNVPFGKREYMILKVINSPSN